MLHLLEQDPCGTTAGAGLEITNTFFMKKLSDISAEGTNAYKTKKSYEWIRRKGEQLAAKSIH